MKFKNEMARSNDLEQRKAKFVRVDMSRPKAAAKTSTAVEQRVDAVFGEDMASRVPTTLTQRHSTMSGRMR